MDTCPGCKSSGYDLWVTCPCCGETFCRDCGITEELAEELEEEQEAEDGNVEECSSEPEEE